jgi:imidazoleglycerol-phosphate dehydratase
VSVDIGGRPYYEGPLPSGLYDHFMRSFSDEARATIHIVVLRGRDRHHVVEAAFKALGLALCDALVDTGDTVSTKGAVTLTVDQRRG